MLRLRKPSRTGRLRTQDPPTRSTRRRIEGRTRGSAIRRFHHICRTHDLGAILPIGKFAQASVSIFEE